MEEERKQILNSNLRSLLLRFSYPLIIALVFGALYNMIDTIFVGNAVGPLGIAALTIVLPVQIMMFAIGFMVGVGSASIISRSLGAGNVQKAISSAGNAIILNLIISFMIMVPGFLFLDEILLFLGASIDVLPLARSYAIIILGGFFLYSSDVMARMLIRAEGKPRAAMYPTIFGATLNILLDFIFVMVLKMGVTGAAIATVISQLATIIFIGIYFISGKSIYKFKSTDFKFNKKIDWEILKLGAPSFLMATIDSIVILLFNRGIMKYGDDTYIAVVGIGIRLIDLTLMPIFGITQGFSTIVGFNYGARLFKRVKRILGEAVLWTTIIAILVFLVLMIFTEQLLGFFSDDPEFIRKGIIPIRVIVVLFPALGFQFVGGTFFQAIGKAMPALIITLARQVVFLIPAILIFPVFWGLNGIWFSWPFSDFMDFIVTGIFVLIELKIINRKMQDSDLLPVSDIAGS
jgi:putative MATE family efflux protein